MLANAKYIYALDMWTVEKRPNGWYFSKSAYHGDKHDWRGPYASEVSVTLMIARELREEMEKENKKPPQPLTAPKPSHPAPPLLCAGLFYLPHSRPLLPARCYYKTIL